MAKRTDIKKVLIIGSGPIVIGQAAENVYYFFRLGTDEKRKMTQ